MGYKANDGFQSQRQNLRLKRKTPLFDIMTKQDIAFWFGCKERTIEYYCDEYGLPFIKLGKDRYFSETQVYRWMLNHQKQIISDGNGEKAEIPIIFKQTKHKVEAVRRKGKKLVSAKRQTVPAKNEDVPAKNKGVSAKKAK